MSVDNRKIDKVNDYIKKSSLELQKLLNTLRDLILNTDPHIIEDYKWNMPVYSQVKPIIYLNSSKDYVKFGLYHGSELASRFPKAKIEGTGKNMRHIKIHQESQIDEKLIRELIETSIQLNSTK